MRSVRVFLAAVPLPVSSEGNSRPTPLTTPEVTVDSKPDGLPMATASWPTTGASPLSNVAAGRSSRFTFITAISVFGSVPTIFAFSMVPASGEGHLHAGGPFDDMVVCDDVTVRTVDHTAPKTPRPSGSRAVSPRTALTLTCTTLGPTFEATLATGSLRPWMEQAARPRS